MITGYIQNRHPWLEAFVIIALLTGGPALADTAQLQAAATTKPAQTQILGAHLVSLPADTLVVVSLKQPLSSATANMGDVVPIVVDQEVDYDGSVVIAKGADGQATVTTVEHAGSNGHGGKLVVTMDWVFATDGSKIALSNASQSGSSGDKKGAASTAAIAGYVLLGPLGLFAHNFVHGKDVTIGTDKTFNMFTDHNVEVNQIHSAAPESTVTPAATPAANQLSGAAYLG